MGAKANPNRRSDITAALNRAGEMDMLSLEDLAFVWGTTKGPFVTAKKNMPGFPPAIPQGTQHIYAARAALQAMLDYEMRNDAQAADIAQRRAAILGELNPKRDADAIDTTMPVREMRVLSQMQAEMHEREREQREYIPAAEVAATAGDVFSELSEFIASLSNKVDPNGLLDPQIRAEIDKQGEIQLIALHKRMKAILQPHVVRSGDRTKAGSARAPRARRARVRSVSSEA